jgi:hypothetical protein
MSPDRDTDRSGRKPAHAEERGPHPFLVMLPILVAAGIALILVAAIDPAQLAATLTPTDGAGEPDPAVLGLRLVIDESTLRIGAAAVLVALVGALCRAFAHGDKSTAGTRLDLAGKLFAVGAAALALWGGSFRLAAVGEWSPLIAVVAIGLLLTLVAALLLVRSRRLERAARRRLEIEEEAARNEIEPR